MGAVPPAELQKDIRAAEENARPCLNYQMAGAPGLAAGW